MSRKATRSTFAWFTVISLLRDFPSLLATTSAMSLRVRKRGWTARSGPVYLNGASSASIQAASAPAPSSSLWIASPRERWLSGSANRPASRWGRFGKPCDREFSPSWPRPWAKAPQVRRQPIQNREWGSVPLSSARVKAASTATAACRPSCRQRARRTSCSLS